MKTIFKGLLFVFILIPSLMMAQSTVTGTVIEQATSLPLPTVNVLIKNTTKGTVTDFDGNYNLQANNGDVLVFSYVGFLTQEVAYTGQARIDVALVEDSAQL